MKMTTQIAATITACVLIAVAPPSFADGGTICGANVPNCATPSGGIPTPSKATLRNGALFDTTFPEPNKMHVSITPPAHETDVTENVYFALLVGNKLYFQTSDGKYSEYAGGTIPALYTHAQSQCRSGSTFGFNYSFPSLSSFTDLARMMPGAAFYAGYGASEADMLNNGKYAVVYSVPLK